MKDYFYNHFTTALRQINFTQPNETVRNRMRDPQAVFFGGNSWDNVKADLAHVPADERPKFILSLFMVVLMDQCIYTHFRDNYPAWRRETNCPKFGKSRLFSAHHLDPFKIIWAPEREKEVELDQVLALLPEFVAFMKGEIDHYFKDKPNNISAERFFDLLKKENAYQYKEGKLVTRLKELL